jgi:hypothetical protein
MKNKFLFLAIILAIFSVDASAQTKKKKPVKKTETSKSSEVQVFDEGDDKDFFDSKKNKEIRNTLKINPLAALVGDMPLYYERVLSPKFSVEAGVGLTLKSRLGSSLATEIGFGGTDLGDNVVTDKSLIGPYYSIALRYFPTSRSNTIPEGLYFSLASRYRKYSFDIHLDNESLPFDDKQSKVTQLDLGRITVGYVWMSDKFTSEIFGGFGVRKVTIDTHFYNAANNYAIEPLSKSYQTPALIVGYRLGFGF